MTWMLLAVSVAGLWTIGNKRIYGWLISLASEVLWLAYGITSAQYAFVVMAVVFAAVHVRNWLKWRGDDD